MLHNLAACALLFTNIEKTYQTDLAAIKKKGVDDAAAEKKKGDDAVAAKQKESLDSFENFAFLQMRFFMST